jgi:hypothetical protein
MNIIMNHVFDCNESVSRREQIINLSIGRGRRNHENGHS